jgi:hypothetical protein
MSLKDDLPAEVRFVLDCRQGEREQLEGGLDYPDQHVRVASVHAREDLWIIVHHLGEIRRALRGIRVVLWALTLIALAAAVALYAR